MGDFWKPTADMFSSLFEKPKMTEKYLLRPPFKYIMDIIAETIKATNYADGLYTAEEFNEKYYDDREKKNAFLKKMMDLTSMMLKEECPAKPAKILAGQEPENTNLFLQSVYRAAVSGEDSSVFVPKVLARFVEGGAKPEPEKKEPQQPAMKKNPSTTKADPKPEPQKEIKPEQKTEVKKKPAPEEKKAPPSKEPVKEPVKEVQKEPQKAPEKPKDKQVRPPSANKKMSKPDDAKGGPRVIHDAKNGDDDDDFPSNNANQNKKGMNMSDIDAKNHGEFVRDALKDVNQASGQDKKVAEQIPGGGIKMTSLRNKKAAQQTVAAGGIQSNNAGKLTEAQPSSIPSANDTEFIKTVIQNITKSANPMGRAVEFLADDIEQMNKELAMWIKNAQDFEERYVTEKKTTDESLQSLYDKITEIEEQIKDQKGKIQSIKTSIMRNTTLINEHLAHVVNSKQI